VYSRYIVARGHCIGYTHTNRGEFCILSFSFDQKVSALQLGFA
jgi:hypothetical protein